MKVKWPDELTTIWSAVRYINWVYTPNAGFKLRIFIRFALRFVEFLKFAPNYKLLLLHPADKNFHFKNPRVLLALVNRLLANKNVSRKSSFRHNARRDIINVEGEQQWTKNGSLWNNRQTVATKRPLERDGFSEAPDAHDYPNDRYFPTNYIRSVNRDISTLNTDICNSNRDFCILNRDISIAFLEISAFKIEISLFLHLRVSLYKYQRLTMEALDMASLRFWWNFAKWLSLVRNKNIWCQFCRLVITVAMATRVHFRPVFNKIVFRKLQNSVISRV